MPPPLLSSSHLRTFAAAFVAALVCALILGAPILFASRADVAAVEREEQVVRNGLRAMVRDMALRSTPQTVWDEAVLNLDAAFNSEWAEENIGVYFSQMDGFEAALVIDGDDRPIYAMRQGATVAIAEVADLQRAYAPLIAAVRGAERQRGPLANAIARQETMSAPILSSQITRINGAPSIVAAVLVQPDFGASMPAGERAAVVVTVETIDTAVVAAFGDQFLLRDAHMHDNSEPIEPHHAAVDVYDSEGRVVAALDWLPPRPGAAILWQAMPPLTVGLGLLAGISFGLFRLNKRARTRLLASEARNKHLAYHDALTGLPNRLLLGERLSHAIETIRRDGGAFAVHCIDLDRFKEVNDTFGHQTGDDLIQAASRKLAALCGDHDTLARIGGDEFALIQPHASQADAANFARLIVEALAMPFDVGVGSIFAGGSVGVTIIAAADIEPQECLRQADLALYQVKAKGRGHFAFFEGELDQAVRTRRLICDDLRLALARDELTLAYQPQVQNGDVYGVEALVRWHHATRGNISPSVFVPIAEEGGLIETLGLFTLRRAFADSKRLAGVRIAINVSAAQIRLRGFVDQLQALILETNVDPTQFELEITEAILLGDEPAIQATLQQLRSLGFRIALDDFGTGYSSLSYLQRYPIDKIKIDRSFIAHLGVEENSDAVVGAIVRLARALRLDVIAEGVETEAQCLRLAAAGCRDIQGYLFGKPMGLDEVCSRFLDTAEPAQKQVSTIAP